MSSLVDELKRCAVRILDSRQSLTAIQKEAAQESLEAELALRGIKYVVHRDWENSPHNDSSCIHFALSSVFVEDTAMLADVQGKGLFPISLSLGDHVSISFEPRHIRASEMSLQKWKQVNNAEYFELTKGQSFAFCGRVTYGEYFFREVQAEHFRFGIVAATPDGDGGRIPYFLQALRDANQANHEFKPWATIIGYFVLVPAAAVKSIVTLPFRLFKSISK